jgi:YedE family putative selenium metabolism protein
MHQSIESDRRRLFKWTLFSGLLLGVAGVLLLRLGNPPNMGICAACFLRDTTGALQLFSKPQGLQYLRPEIPAFILGSFLAALFFGEFRSRGGASPAIRFILGAFVMVGALVFLGCPIRLMERLAAGDLLSGGAGFVGMLAGIAVASFFIKKGFTLGPGRDQAGPAAVFAPIMGSVLLLVLVYFAFISETDPKGILKTKWHAPVLLSFFIALAVGFVAQRSRFCTTGGFRDIVLTGEFRLFWGYAVLLFTLVAGNLVVDFFWPGIVRQFEIGNAPIAHHVHLWNFLGMFLVGMGSVLLGGCPFRQMTAAGQGNSDAFITVLGLIFGAAFCHNFGLASTPSGPDAAGGPGTAGQVAVVLGIAVTFVLGFFCSGLWRNNHAKR